MGLFTRKNNAFICANTDFKYGFTLAEVLITLGIIGVVAAMTIPNLITSHQKRVTVTKLQKAISVINQAYKMAYEDVGEASAEEAMALGGEEYFKNYWAPYIKVNTYCNEPKDCGYKSHNPFKRLDGNSNSTVRLISKNNRVTFNTMDGFLYIIMTRSSRIDPDGNHILVSSPYVIVDINGGRNPNQYGKDVFFLTRVPDGKGIQPYGYNFTNELINKYCSKTEKSSNGDTCAEKIKRAGWQIDKSYPW